MLHTKPFIDAFAIVAGDGDLVPLLAFLRANGKQLLTVATEMDIYLVAGACLIRKLIQSRDYCTVCCACLLEANHILSTESIVRKHPEDDSLVILRSNPVPA